MLVQDGPVQLVQVCKLNLFATCFSLRSECSQNLHAFVIKDRRCVVFCVLEWRVRTKGMWPGHPPSAEEPLLVFCWLKIFEEALSKMRGV